MDHDEKVSQMLDNLSSRGMGRFTIAPPGFRLAWLLGWKVKPPLFLGFFALFFGLGIPFSILWGILMGLMGHFSSFENGIFPSVGAGIIFGLIMAIYYRVKARELDLPPWNHYLKER